MRPRYGLNSFMPLKSLPRSSVLVARAYGGSVANAPNSSEVFRELALAFTCSAVPGCVEEDSVLYLCDHPAGVNDYVWIYGDAVYS